MYHHSFLTSALDGGQ